MQPHAHAGMEVRLPTGAHWLGGQTVGGWYTTLNSCSCQMPEGKSLRLTDGQRAPRSREGRLERPGGGGGRLHLHHGSCELSTKYKCKLSCACVLQCTKQNTDQRRLNIDVFTRMCRCFTNYNTALTVDGEGQTQSAHKVRTGELDGRHQ